MRNITLCIIQDIKSVVNKLFNNLQLTSMYKKVEIKLLNSYIVRVDVILKFGLIARFVFDIQKRIPNTILIGYLRKGKFFTINDFPFVLKNDSFDEIIETKSLVKLLDTYVNKYRYRVHPNGGR